MASSAPALSALLKRSTITDHDEVIKACNSALKTSPNDTEAQHIRVIALIKSDRYDDALRQLDEGGEKLKSRAPLEHAYVLYKLGRQKEAGQIAKSTTQSRGARHLEAQAYYRLENFAEASRLYEELVKEKAQFETEGYDLKINRGATDAQLEWSRDGELVKKKKATREDLEAFETAYNAACGCIARGELSQAEILLKRARDLCQASDEFTQEEKDAELLPIAVQQIYVYKILGKTAQADELSKGLELAKISDLSTRQIAQVNKLASHSKSPQYSPYLTQRILESLPELSETDKFFNFQGALKESNDSSMELEIFKYKGVIKQTTKTLKDQPSPTTSSRTATRSIANAAAHAQSQLGKLGLKSILPLLERRPHDVGLIVTIVHLYVLTKNHGSAILVLESFLNKLDTSDNEANQDVRYAPGLVAILVSLYATEGRKSHIRTELARAASYWRRKSKYPPHLLRTAGVALLDSGSSADLKLAGELFSTLLKRDPKDRTATAGYVAAHATTEMDKTAEMSQQLTPINKLTAGIDAAALEAAGFPRSTAAPSTTAMSKKRAAESDATKPIKKRVRKSRLAKDLDASKQPDPERWLPLRDRSTYRPKGKKGKQKAAGPTQGGVSDKGSEGLNMTAPDAVAKPTSQVLGGPASKPKKKKGKK
ncbi:Signal recognition particle core component [Agyrium rufum]|nr:Signal recognition particle core component [Agyrium rufum]